jgi:hypothetical protein
MLVQEHQLVSRYLDFARSSADRRGLTALKQRKEDRRVEEDDEKKSPEN